MIRKVDWAISRVAKSGSVSADLSGNSDQTHPENSFRPVTVAPSDPADHHPLPKVE
jgi:hypothetical protein